MGLGDLARIDLKSLIRCFASLTVDGPPMFIITIAAQTEIRKR